MVAFYLPQFFPTAENDQWWGKGFTEWTNTGKAKPLFCRHYQPKVPADLGYYDLRVPQVREQQAALAAGAGIDGFCYWHYWFSGRRMLERVFTEVVDSGKPDYPFCLCWANHSWYAKTWSVKMPDRLLIEQTYLGEEDYKAHFYELLPAFEDKRYMRVDNKPVFCIWDAENPHISSFMQVWQRLAAANGLSDGFYFIAFSHKQERLRHLLSAGFEGAIADYSLKAYSAGFAGEMRKVCKTLLHTPRLLSYRHYADYVLRHHPFAEHRFFPCILPNFDHTPRSGRKGLVLTHATPQAWRGFLHRLFDAMQEAGGMSDFVFIKAWNEWGEGNYLEPDLRYGHGYLEALGEVLSEAFGHG
jgi:hypothetical protein